MEAKSEISIRMYPIPVRTRYNKGTSTTIISRSPQWILSRYSWLNFFAKKLKPKNWKL